MAIGDIINNSDLIPQLSTEIGKLATWIQALGIVVIFWVIFNIILIILNLKKKKLLKNIQSDIKRLEKKFDRLSKIK